MSSSLSISSHALFTRFADGAKSTSSPKRAATPDKGTFLRFFFAPSFAAALPYFLSNSSLLMVPFKFPGLSRSPVPSDVPQVEFN